MPKAQTLHLLDKILELGIPSAVERERLLAGEAWSTRQLRVVMEELEDALSRDAEEGAYLRQRDALSLRSQDHIEQLRSDSRSALLGRSYGLLRAKVSTARLL